MADLSVTDVQKALRTYVAHGHDVISDPHAVIINNEKYGMSVGHTLVMSRFEGKPSHKLASTIQQSERPLLSHIISSNEKGLEQIVPLIATNPTAGSRFMNPYVTRHMDEVHQHMPHHLWVHRNNYNNDPNAVLKHHQTGEIPRELQNIFLDNKPFNNKEAIQDFHNASVSGVSTAFKGLVIVRNYRNAKDGHYIYDPATEKLMHYA